jgi:hypothetical protein
MYTHLQYITIIVVLLSVLIIRDLIVVETAKVKAK